MDCKKAMKSIFNTETKVAPGLQASGSQNAAPLALTRPKHAIHQVSVIFVRHD